MEDGYHIVHALLDVTPFGLWPAQQSPFHSNFANFKLKLQGESPREMEPKIRRRLALVLPFAAHPCTSTISHGAMGGAIHRPIMAEGKTSFRQKKCSRGAAIIRTGCRFACCTAAGASGMHRAERVRKSVSLFRRAPCISNKCASRTQSLIVFIPR